MSRDTAVYVPSLANEIAIQVALYVTAEERLNFLIALRMRTGMLADKLVREHYSVTKYQLGSLAQEMADLKAQTSDAESCYKDQRMVDSLLCAGIKKITVRALMPSEAFSKQLAFYHELALPQVENPKGAPQDLLQRFRLAAQLLKMRQKSYVHFRTPAENVEYLERIVLPLAEAIFHNRGAMNLTATMLDVKERAILREIVVDKLVPFDFRRMYRFPPPGQLMLPRL